MDRTIESAFFDIFKQGGIASMCVEILEVKYKLNKSLLNQIAGNSDWEEFYTKILPEQIKQKACDLNVDFDRLFTEVRKNLSEYKTNPTEFSNYCLSLLSPFADFLRKVKPSKHRERERQMKMDDVRLLLDSGSDEDRELANDIQSRVEGMIADWENIEKEFRTILKKHTEIPTEELEKYFEGNYTETIFAELMRMLKGYAIGLDWILAQIGIDLLKLQNDGGIYLIESRNIYDYTQFAGTMGIAQRVFNALSQNETPQQEYNEISDMTANDLLLRTFFGKHLNDFLKEAQTCKNGTEVARLVNWYINEYKLDTGRTYRKKPLHDALLEKGVIRIKQSAWNNAIK